MVGVTSSTLMSGLVKAVPSGDTLTVMKQINPVSGPPPEMRLTLSSVKAPLLSRDFQSDEPCAWTSRETLRKRLIGRTVYFRIDYRVAAVSRVFATVYASATDDKSINLDVVEAGLARVRRPATQSEDVSPELDALIEAEERATTAQLGVHSSAGSAQGRKLPAADAPVLEGDALVLACSGKKLNGIVEYVATGSVVKVFVQDVPRSSEQDLGDRMLTVSLAGVQCPGFRRAEGEDPSVPPTAMPYAKNAKFLTEVRLQNRDVAVWLQGVDRNGMIFATVEDPTAKQTIAEELLRAGMAKTMSWSLDVSARAPALRAAERFARDKQAGVWKGFQKALANREEFSGKVIEVVSGDMLVILDDATAEAKRITLASVRASRAERGSRDRSTMPTGPAADAKEAMRKRMIGRRVSVKVEYTREPAADAVRKEVMTFATVSREGDAKTGDIALQMISNGLLSVVRHRGEEDRAGNYEEYLDRETKAQEAKKGMHGNNAVNSGIRVNNLTGPDAKKRSRDVLAGLQRNGPYKGVVEYVSSASRYRVYLPGESMLVTLALRAVRCPQSTRRTYGPDGSVREEIAGEPHGDEAADFAREQLMQREVEVDIQNVDRVGAFLGNLFLLSTSGERTDVSSLLLTSGHGYLHESFDASRDRGGARYISAEREAREAKRGAWSDYEEAAVATPRETDESERKFKGTVCEIGFGGRIFVQAAESSASALAAVESGLAAMGLDKVGEIPLAALKPGSMVAAKFSADGRWYRARVLFVPKGVGAADVRFVDYGNEERVDAKDLRRLGTGSVFGMAPVAVEVCLRDLVVPGEEDGCGIAAGEALRDFTYGKEVEVVVMGNEAGGKSGGRGGEVLVGDVLVGEGGAGSSSDSNGGGKKSLREEMLKTGLARIVRKKNAKSVSAFKELRRFEEIGIQTRQYLWNYGEAFESDCDEEGSG